MGSVRLFHFSEDGCIDTFCPRPVEVPAPRTPGQEWLNGPLVWAVDEQRQATYCFPRECPRIVLWLTEHTSALDRDAWWGRRECTMIANVEWAWLQRIRDVVLYRYELPAATFRPTDDAWMWVSDAAVTPIAVERLHDAIGRLEALGVELRIMQTLLPLRSAWESTLHVSGIRLRNALGWPTE